MTDEKSKTKYDLDLRRFSSKRKAFPWAVVLRSVLGIAMLLLIVYLIREIIVQRQQAESIQQNGEIREFNIEVDTVLH